MHRQHSMCIVPFPPRPLNNYFHFDYAGFLHTTVDCMMYYGIKLQLFRPTACVLLWNGLRLV